MRQLTLQMIITAIVVSGILLFNIFFLNIDVYHNILF